MDSHIIFQIMHQKQRFIMKNVVLHQITGFFITPHPGKFIVKNFLCKNPCFGSNLCCFIVGALFEKMGIFVRNSSLYHKFISDNLFSKNHCVGLS